VRTPPYMPERPGATELSVDTDDGVVLAGEQAGDGQAIVLLHGLTATRRYVVMGSRLLERSGLRAISYDARGHGHSTAPSDPGSYGYERLALDLLAVLDALGIGRALLAGASMGAHTIVRFASDHPERVAAMGLITPAFDPDALDTPAPSGASDAYAGWDALARGLREGGVEGFLAAYDFASVPDRWRATVETVVAQRLAAHDHPGAVADALEVVPRSHPFEALDELTRIEVPAVVIASRDEADPSHPLAVGERYAQLLPGASLIVEDAGPPVRSPIAWQGGQLSKALLSLAGDAR
jgi:pimeloyl-ACP methyl ester carboxylesterase